MTKGRLITVLIILLGLTFAPISAQEDNYRLRMPSVQEYLAAIPQVFEVMDEVAPYSVNQEYLLRVVYRELTESYPEFTEQEFELVYDAMQSLRQGFYGRISILNTDMDDYYTILLETLLSNDVIDFLSSDTLMAEPFSINIQPVDLNGDGDDELLLDIYAEGNNYHAFKVLDDDQAETSGYRIVETPVMWFDTSCDFRTVCGGDAQLYEIRDVNLDGMLDLAFAVGGYCGYGECGGHLAIWGWHDDTMVSLLNFPGPSWTGPSGGGGGSILPSEDLWQFENVDDDTLLELVQRWDFTDNRGCNIRRTTVFDWQPLQYAYVEDSVGIRYADTGACALREGHEAFRNSDYDTAINAYSHAVMQLTEDTEAEAQQYAAIRLALAYALNGDVTQARLQMQELLNAQPESDSMALFIDTFEDYLASGDPIALCMSMRDAFAYPPRYEVGPSNITQFGSLDDVPARPLTYVGGDFGPDATACVLLSFLQVRFAQDDLTNSDTLIEDVNQLILPVSTYERFDIDDDSDLDWLIWFDEQVNQNIVILNQPDFAIFPLFLAEPDDSISDESYTVEDTTLLVRRDINDDEAASLCEDGGYSERLLIYRWTGRYFHNTNNLYLCERRDMSDIFPTTNQLVAWNYVSSEVGIAEAQLMWNDEQQQFVVERYLEDLPELRRGNFDCSVMGKGPYFCGFNEDYETALQRADEVLTDPPDHLDRDGLLAIRYLRALALEALDRPDEALAEYLAIIDTAPESVWGMLAALHVEADE